MHAPAGPVTRALTGRDRYAPEFLIRRLGSSCRANLLGGTELFTEPNPLFQPPWTPYVSASTCLGFRQRSIFLYRNTRSGVYRAYRPRQPSSQCRALFQSRSDPRKPSPRRRHIGNEQALGAIIGSSRRIARRVSFLRIAPITETHLTQTRASASTASPLR